MDIYLEHTHLHVMDLEELDDIIINRPLSKEKRLAIYNQFLQKAFLKGVDKGTLLEISRQNKLEAIHKKKIETRLNEIIEETNDWVNKELPRFKRLKYRGVYKYPKKKKKKNKVKPTIKKYRKLKKNNNEPVKNDIPSWILIQRNEAIQVG